ncbi:MAG TPA: YCF48-related protein [Pyrinomonadaceae bacterium]|nr:YCF48-related protein [Pyrinomonadaceae bacterium]
MTRPIKKISLYFVLLSLTLTLALPPRVFAAEHFIDTTQDAADRTLSWSVAGPMGGDVRELVVDPSNPQHLYLGTIDGQMYQSTDGARTWARVVNFSRPGIYIDNIIIDPRDPKTLYVAAHKHKEPGGFFKSTDGGETWRESVELKTEALHSLAQSSSDPNVLIVGSNKGVYRSQDSGETWEQLPTSAYPDIRNVESIAVDPRNSKAIYIGTWHLPWKTEDGGQTWKSIKTGMIDDSDVFAIEIDEKRPDHVIASACSGIYESQNAGASWRKVQGIPSQSRRTRDILQHPSLPSTIFAGTTEGFWRSTNGGDSWMLNTSRTLEINAIAVHPKEPQTIYIGTNNYGVMVSRDGGKNFLPSNEGYSGRRAYAIAPDRERAGRIYASTINTATGGGFFFVSNDSGATWQPSMRNMPSRLIAYSILQDRTDGNIIYLGTNLGMYRSTDRGLSWSPIGAPNVASPVAKPTKKRPAVAKRRTTTAKGRAASAASRRKAAAASSTASAAAQEPRPAPPVPVSAKRADDTVMRAQAALNAAGYDAGTPDGQAGTRTVAAIRKFQAAKDLPQTGKFDDATLTALGLGGGKQSLGVEQGIQNATIALTETVNALAYLPDTDGTLKILAATNNGLYRSADPVKGWEKMPFGQGLDARTLSVSTSPQNPQTIYVGTSASGVLVSRDGGQTWNAVEGIPKEAPINVIEQDPERSAYVYVGTTHTLYSSHDGGEKWMRRGGNLPYGSFTSILINPKNTDEIFVGSAYERAEGNGVFHSMDAGKTWKRVDPELPSRRVWALAFDTRDSGKLLIGSHSAGVYIANRDQSATITVTSDK